MGYFPLCIDLNGKTVLLIGDGPQIQDKKEKLDLFGAHVIQVKKLTSGDWKNITDELPAFVIVGDTDIAEAEEICELCVQYNIPVNVVDVPGLCTFFFPALIVKGDLTVSVSTGGKSPAAAACLRRRVEAQIPDNTEAILDWLNANRTLFKEKGILKEVTTLAFEKNRPLTEGECAEYM